MTITNLFFDIETIPGQTFMMDEVKRGIAPPAQYSKPESIAKWMEENSAQKALEAQHALGLVPPYGQIVSIAWAFGEGPVTALCTADEKDLLVRFMSIVVDHMTMQSNQYSLRWIGHNVADFDIPYLWWRGLINRVLCPYLPDPMSFKPWDTQKVFDTMVQLPLPGRRRISLANAARVFKLDYANGEVDGSMVWDMWKAGNTVAIEEYNIADVQIVRELYYRIVA